MKSVRDDADDCISKHLYRNEPEVGKSDDIKSINNIFGSPVSARKEVGRVDGWINCEKRLIFYSAWFNLNFKNNYFKKHHFLTNPIYSLYM
jgi:hypothetical protein